MRDLAVDSGKRLGHPCRENDQQTTNMLKRSFVRNLLDVICNLLFSLR